MIKDVPIIPTTESVDWYQYNTKDLEGWPTQDDPYAQPAPYNIPDVGQVLTEPVLQVGPEVSGSKEIRP